MHKVFIELFQHGRNPAPVFFAAVLPPVRSFLFSKNRFSCRKIVPFSYRTRNIHSIGALRS